MDLNNIVEIVKTDGSMDKVSVITYLLSDDGARQYIVYTKVEDFNVDEDKVIYISKISNNNNVLTISEISDDIEWNEVQKLLRRIANAKQLERWYFMLTDYNYVYEDKKYEAVVKNLKATFFDVIFSFVSVIIPFIMLCLIIQRVKQPMKQMRV